MEGTNVKTTANANYRYLDAARGLALLLVMISHAHGLNRFLIFYYIQIFFIISGYIYRPGHSYGEIIQKKAKRLLIPYFGYSALLWCFYAVIRRDGAAMKHSLFGVIYSRFCLYKSVEGAQNVYLLDIANGAMWYLTAFFVTSLLFHLIADRCLSDRKRMAAVSAALLVLTMLLNELPLLLPWSLDIAGIAAVLMLIGAWMKKMDFFEKKCNPWLLAGNVLLYVGLVELNGRLNMSIRQYGRFGSFSVPFFLIISVTGSTLCIWVCKWTERMKISRFFRYIGTHTMELICLHMLGLEWFEIAARRFVDINSLSGAQEWLYAAVRVTAAVAASLAAGAVIAKLKQWLLGMGKQRGNI